MATYILDGTAPVRLPRGPLSVSIRTTGTPARLEVTGDMGTPVIRPAPHLVILPRLDGPVVLRLVPAGEHQFGPGSSVALTLGIEGARGDDPEQAQLPTVDLIGLPHRDLVALEPRDGGTSVRMAAPIDDETMPGLMGLARAATRRVLGVDRVPDERAVRVVLALDASASGRLLARDGATAAITEVMLGLSRVVAPEPPRVAVIAGDDLTWVRPTTDVDALARASREAVAAVPPTVGFRAAHPELRAVGRHGRVVTYVVTDGVPADVSDLEAGESSGDGAAHLVLVGDAAVGSSGGSVSSTHVRTREDESLGDRLSRSPTDLDAIVRGLLSACFPADTDPARRATT